MDYADFFARQTWHRPGRGPRYQQLYRHMSAAILAGELVADDQIPSERDLAEFAGISRVTVRKAVVQLVADGLIDQRRGAGSFVCSTSPKLKQSLSTLVSFTENLFARGMTSSSEVLAAGVHTPTPSETLTFGLSSHDLVGRVSRLRSASDMPMAIEHSTLPSDILPNPDAVNTSLYSVLRANGQAPTRAIQRVSAINLDAADAALLKLPVAMQPQYNLLDRGVELEVLPCCLEAGIALTPWSPLGGGWLTGKYTADARPSGATRLGENPDRGVEAYDVRNTPRTHKILQVLCEIAERHNRPPAHVALAWLSSRPGVATVLLGARTVPQLKENLAATDLVLAQADIDELTKVSAVGLPAYPYAFVEQWCDVDIWKRLGT